MPCAAHCPRRARHESREPPRAQLRRWRHHTTSASRVHAVTLALAAISTFCKEVGITALLVCSALDWIELLRPPPPRPPSAAARAVRAPRVLGWCCRHIALAVGAAGLLGFRLSLNGWRSPTFSSADNSAAFCETRLCRGLSISYLYWLNLRWAHTAAATASPPIGSVHGACWRW